MVKVLFLHKILSLFHTKLTKHFLEEKYEIKR